MINEINTTQFSAPLNGKSKVGFCIDDNGTAWVNIEMISPAINLLSAAFDGVPFTRINKDQFVCANWARIELQQAFCHDNKALQVIHKFFDVIENEKQKVLGGEHAKH